MILLFIELKRNGKCFLKSRNSIKKKKKNNWLSWHPKALDYIIIIMPKLIYKALTYIFTLEKIFEGYLKDNIIICHKQIFYYIFK